MGEVVPLGEPVPARFADRLVYLRRLHCESAEAAARRIGIGVRSYSRWASGECEPRLSSVRKVASAYGVELSWVQGGEGEPPKEPPVPADRIAALEARVEALEAKPKRWWRRG